MAMLEESLHHQYQVVEMITWESNEVIKMRPLQMSFIKILVLAKTLSLSYCHYYLAGVNFSIFVDPIIFFSINIFVIADKLDNFIASYKQCYMFTASLFVTRLEGFFSGKLSLIQCHLATQ